MEQTLLAYCRRQGLFRLGDRVIVACSGGADSMALLCFLLRCKAELGITVMAAHVDHGIRGEAAHADARFVAEFCRTHHVPFFLYDAAARAIPLSTARMTPAWRDCARQNCPICRKFC